MMAEALAEDVAGGAKMRHSVSTVATVPEAYKQTRRSRALSKSAPHFPSGSSINYEVRAARAEREYRPTRPEVLVAFALFYIVAVVLGVVGLVSWSMTRIEMVMLIPLLLSLLMYIWLCMLSWPLRYRYNTISAACASQNKNFLRILLVLLTCLLSTALSAVLVDEYEQHRNPRYSAFVISELIFSLLTPLTGLFPTVEIPREPLRLSSWGHVNLGTIEHPVNVPGMISFGIHFIGVIPFMFGLPIINCVYALQSRPQTWVLVMAFGAVACLLSFVVLQILIHLQHKSGALQGVQSDTLFVLSFACELLLVITVSLGTFLFSLKRNQNVPVDWDLDRRVQFAFRGNGMPAKSPASV